MEAPINIVHKPIYVSRPFSSIEFPYANHPECSVLCQHAKASLGHRSLIEFQRNSWRQQLRPHATKSLKSLDGDDRGEGIPTSRMTFTPLGVEGFRLSIPEEFLTKFARSDSRPDSPTPTLVRQRNCKLDCYRRCVTPDSLDPMFVAPPKEMVRSKSEGGRPSSSLIDFHALKLSGSKKSSKRKFGRAETDFTTKLSKQLDLAAKNRASGNKTISNVSSEKEAENEGMLKSKRSAKSSDDQSLTSEGKPEGKRRGIKKSKTKADDGTRLDDPELTAVSALPESRVASSRQSHSSSSSSKHTSPHSSKSGSAKKSQIRDPLSYDPKQFLSEGHRKDDQSDIEALRQTSQSQTGDSDPFWLGLPRVPSRMSAVFSLPVQLKRLEGLTPLTYLQKHLSIRSSRKQLHQTIFMKFRDAENVRIERLPVERIPLALADSLGGTIPDHLLEKCKRYAEVENQFINVEHFVILAGVSERFYSQEILSHFDSDIEERDLVERLDFNQLNSRIQDLDLKSQLKELLQDIEKLI